MKTKISERPSRSLVALPGTVRFTFVPLDGHSATPGWFFRRHPSSGLPKRCQTALRGRPSANSMTIGCHSPGERRPRNLSVPPDRLFKTMARPPKGQPCAPGTRRGIETSLGPSPRCRRRRRSNGSARPAGRLSGRRCLPTVRCPNGAIVHRVRRGGQSNSTGSGTPPQRGQVESSSK